MKKDSAVDDWDRHVRFEACFNFRDLGGYATREGREVRRGQLYRSDSLHRLSANDLTTLAAMGIRAVIDLRTSAELVAHGRVADQGPQVFRHVPLDEVADDGYLRPRPEHYLEFAFVRRHQIVVALQYLAAEDGPFVFHCMAGKDRTGVLAALLLALLGVPDTTIGEDYALTEQSIDPALAWANEHDPNWAAWLTRMAPSGLLQAPADVIVGFLASLRARFGSVHGFLADAGLRADTPHALRDRYVT